MLHRLALLAASVVASAILAVGLAILGSAVNAPRIETLAPAAAADQGPATVVDTVYVAPPAPNQAVEPEPTPIVVTRVVTAHGQGDDGDKSHDDHEGHDGDKGHDGDRGHDGDKGHDSGDDH